MLLFMRSETLLDYRAHCKKSCGQVAAGMLIYCREIVNLYGPASSALRRLRRSAALVGRLPRLFPPPLSLSLAVSSRVVVPCVRNARRNAIRGNEESISRKRLEGFFFISSKRFPLHASRGHLENLASAPPPFILLGGRRKAAAYTSAQRSISPPSSPAAPCAT
jgi:hypothetical protein